MLLNVSKTKVLHFRRRNTPLTNYQFTFGNELLEYVNDYKYLGTSFDQHLTMETAKDELSKGSSRALSHLISKTKANFDLTYSVYSKLYHTCVVPVMDYSSGVWSLGKECPKLDQVQDVLLNTFVAYLGQPPVWV